MTGLLFKFTVSGKYNKEVGIPLSICTKNITVGGAVRQYDAELANTIKELQSQRRKLRAVPVSLKKEIISEVHYGPITIPQ